MRTRSERLEFGDHRSAQFPRHLRVPPFRSGLPDRGLQDSAVRNTLRGAKLKSAFSLPSRRACRFEPVSGKVGVVMKSRNCHPSPTVLAFTIWIEG